MYYNPQHGRILNTVIAVDAILIREKELSTLMKEVSKVLTQTSQYYFVWIGLFNRNKELVHIESSGNARGFREFKTRAGMGMLPLKYRDLLFSANQEIGKDSIGNCTLEIEKKDYISFITPFKCDNESHGLLWCAVPDRFATDPKELDLIKDVVGKVEITIAGIKEKQDLIWLLNTAQNAYVVLDYQSNIISVNDTFISFFNYSRDHFMGKKLIDVVEGLFAKDLPESIKQTLDDLLVEGNDMNSAEIRIKDNVYQLSFNLHNPYKCRVLVIKDITSEKTKQLELKKSETKYRTLFNAINDAILIHPASDTRLYTFIEANDQACKHFGYTRKELFGLTSYDLIVQTGENSRILFENRERLLAKGWTIFELQSMTKKGQSIPVEVSARLFEIDGRKMVLSLVRDIGDRRQAEEKQQASERMLKTVLQSIPSGFLLIDDNYVIRQVNDLTCKITGYTSEELIGNECDMLCAKGKGSKECPIWEKGVRCFANRDTYIKGKNNKKTPILKNAQMLNIQGKNYILESFQDTTQLKHTESELIQAKNKAEESDQLKSSFLANMSHEVRTPMNSILGFTEQLKYSNLTDAEKQEYLNIIHTNGKRIQTTIHDILDLSKIESGIEKVKREQIALKGFLNELFLFFQSEAEEKNLGFEFENANDFDDSFIYSDPEKLSSILSNLIKNAIKFTQTGSVVFGYRAKNNEVEFVIRDTGIGIPADRQQAIFDSFVQADVSGARLYEGAGLGLSIAKSYTKALGGLIRFESAENKGTTFYVRIPKDEITKTEVVDEQVEVKLENTGNLNVVVAINDKEWFYVLEQQLQPVVASVLHLQSGEEVLQTIKNQPETELLLIDVDLGGAGGLAVAEQIREFNQKIKIIAQTASDNMEDNLKAFESGCDDYLVKPFNKKELLECVERLFVTQ